jgi:hypothetical protein
VPTDATSLGILRAAVCGFILCQIILTSFADLGRLPVTLLRPVGVMKFIPWRIYELVLTPAGMLTFKWLFALCLLAASIGLFSSLGTKSSLVLFVFYEGLLRSFSHFNHDEMPAVYILAVLAFSPSGDGFSLDSRFRNSRSRAPGIVYGYPILLMRLLLAWSYFTSGLIKLRVAGLSYLKSDNLPSLAIVHSLDNLHDTNFRFAFWLPRLGQYASLIMALVLLWELLFPLAVFSKRARIPLLLLGVVFHVATLLFMNIFFPYHLAMYVVFIDWTGVVGRLRTLWTRPRPVSEF